MTDLPPVYYINMERSEARRIAMENEFQRYGIDATRVEAVDGSDRESLDSQIRTPSYHRIRYPREMATTASHLRAINSAYRDGQEMALILEDDVEIGLMFKTVPTLQDVISRLPDDWEILHLVGLTGLYREALAKPDLFSFRPFVTMEEYPSYFAAAYIINRRGMARLSEHIRQDGVVHICDCFLEERRMTKPFFEEYHLFFADHFIFGRCRSYRTTKPYANIKAEDTNIQLDNDGNFIDHHKNTHQRIRDYISLHHETTTWILFGNKVSNRHEVTTRLLRRGIYNFLFLDTSRTQGVPYTINLDKRVIAINEIGGGCCNVSTAMKIIRSSPLFASLGRLVVVLDDKLNLMILNCRNDISDEPRIMRTVAKKVKGRQSQINRLDLKGLVQREWSDDDTPRNFVLSRKGLKQLALENTKEDIHSILSRAMLKSYKQFVQRTGRKDGYIRLENKYPGTYFRLADIELPRALLGGDGAAPNNLSADVDKEMAKMSPQKQQSGEKGSALIYPRR